MSAVEPTSLDSAMERRSISADTTMTLDLFSRTLASHIVLHCSQYMRGEVIRKSMTVLIVQYVRLLLFKKGALKRRN